MNCIRGGDPASQGSGCAWNMVALATVVFWCVVLGGLLLWWLRNFG